MKVRLTYGTHIDKVLPTIINLLRENVAPLHEADDLLNASATMLQADSDESCKHVVGTIDRIRKSLSLIDESLADINGLLAGYVASMIEKHQAQEPNVARSAPEEAR